MRCNHCKTENEPGMKFCHCCGKPLESSTIDRYPELKLKPTSVYKLKQKITILFIHLLISIVLYFLFALLLSAIFSVTSLLEHEADAIFTAFFLSPTLIIIYFLKFRKHFISKRINNVADYFQSTQNKYLFIIKDGKFGVYNRLTHKVQIPCQYTFLQWKINFKVLTATTSDGRTIDIDIKNNRLS